MSGKKQAEMIPTAPLVEAIHRWCDEDHTQGTLALWWAERYDVKLSTAKRTLTRIVGGEQSRVWLDTADKLCLTMGTHPVLVYGATWGPEATV